MTFKLTVLGCNAAIPTVNKNPAAHLLNVNERFFLIDCGEGTQTQLRKYKITILTSLVDVAFVLGLKM